MPTPFKLSSEEEAYALVERVLADQVKLTDLAVTFTTWPKLEIVLEGPQFKQSLTPSVMSSLIDLQRAMTRAIALELGYASSVHLPREIREALDFQVYVYEGSSKLVQDLAEGFNRLSKVLSRMESKDLTKIFVTGALVWGGVASYKGYMEAKIREAEIQLENKKVEIIDQRERRYLDLLEEFIDHENMGPFFESSREVQEQAIRTLSYSEKGTVQGTELFGSEATRIVRAPRREAVGCRLDGRYGIREVKVKSEGFKLLIENLDTREEFWADIRKEDLSAKDVTILGKSTFQYIPAEFKINGKRLESRITEATIVESKLGHQENQQ